MSTAVYTATDFKATCLEVFDRLAARELERVEVTKRGKVVAVLTPPDAAGDWLTSFQAAMRGTVTIPEGADLTEPAFDGVMDADLGILHR